ncbi:DRP5A, partial [Symbiodinium pilosum]
DNVNQWVDGFGDLPDNLVRFALTLPWWQALWVLQDGEVCPAESFVKLREEFNQKDVKEMRDRSLKQSYMETIGFQSFASFMEKKIEHMFADAINPVLDKLRDLKGKWTSKEQSLVTEHEETDPHRILSTTRECGTSFAQALRHVMEGIPNLMTGRMNLDSELRQFHEHHLKVGSDHFVMLPSEDFCDLDDYIAYLTNEIQVGASDAEVNGGAQFRRVMSEVEIFLRFSEIAVETKKRDVIQARGVSMSSLTWRDVVVKLLSNEAHLPLQRRVQYVGERIKWFFQIQKEAVVDFMSSLEGNPSSTMYSSLLWKNVKLIKQNEMIKHLVFSTYDQACQRQLNQFIELFDNMLTSTFANPWVFLKGATYGGYTEEEDADAALPSIDDTKERIPKEIQSRSGIESTLSKWLLEIPTESHQIDEAVDKVQMLVLKTYSFIRSQVCDQVELFAESFFKLPMLRRLEEDMNKISLSDADKTNYKARSDIWLELRL